jgi:hypothetical protein
MGTGVYWAVGADCVANDNSQHVALRALKTNVYSMRPERYHCRIIDAQLRTHPALAG